MNVKHAPAAVTESRERHGYAHVPVRWLLPARGVWLGLVILTLAIVAGSLPVYVAQLQTPCAGSACGYLQLTLEQARALRGTILFPGMYTAYTVALTLASMVLSLVVSTVIVRRRSDDRMALIVALLLVTLGPLTVTFNVSAGHSLWQVPNEFLSFLFVALFLLVLSLFPSGRWVPRWMRWPVVVLLALQVPFSFFPAVAALHISAVSLGFLVFVGGAPLLVVAQLYRYRRASSPVERQQTKWVVFGLAVPITYMVLGTVAYLLFPAASSPGSLYLPAYAALQDLLFLLIPLSFGFAMLRYHLWDIDVLINRTLVYGLLTAIIAGMYVLVVGILSTLLHAFGNVLIALLATGLIAVFFRPLHTRLQRMINRLMYGQRDEPYAVLSRLLSRLEATLDPDRVLPTIVETTASALKLPYTAITLKQGETFTPAATFGIPQDKLFTLPLVYHTEIIGQLLLAPRAPGDTFTAADRRLLEDLARQAGVVVHAVRLTTDLQRSRERLVTAREEERRRLRRDLHDGLGPQLASLTLKLETARNRLAYDPLADTLLSDLAQRTQATVTDIRRLVYAMRPPALDELGLVSALYELTLQESSQTSTHLEAPTCLPELPAAVEVALYRIAQEALTNVVRHAQARHCTLRLTLGEPIGWLALSIQDDGCGLSSSRGMGIGLISMHERAEELGGTCLIQPVKGGGTRVLARLPYLRSETGGTSFTTISWTPHEEK